MSASVHIFRRLWLAALLISSLVFFAACGGSSSDDESAAAAESDKGTIVQQARQAIEEGAADVTGGVPDASPPVVKSKFIVMVPCAQAGEGCSQPAEAAVEAAKAIGWKAQIIDGKGTADGQSAAIQQALTLKPDAIITFAIDPESIKGAIRAADNAKVPVIGSSSVESPQLAFSNNPTTENWIQTGTLAADYLIAQSDGKAKVLFLTSNEFAAVNQRTDAAEKRLKECEDCAIVQKKNFNFADMATGLPQLVQQSLQAAPDIDAVYVPYDAAVPAVMQGIKALGTEKKLVVAGDGTSDGLACIRKDCGLNATVAFPLAWIGWADIDAANRIFNNEDPKVATATMPVKLITKDNVQAQAGTWNGDYDFRSAYKKIWGVK